MNFMKEGETGREVRAWNGSSSTTFEQLDKLPKFLAVCTYNEETRTAIERAARQVLNVFPSFRVEILQFYESNFLFRLVEMRGDIPVPYCPPLQFFLMFPPTFPKAPPFFRVLNPNPQTMTLKPIYQQNQSKNDPRSLVLNAFLSEARGWNAAKSVVGIVIEVNNLVRSNYPYQRVEQINQNYPIWGFNNSPRQRQDSLNNNQNFSITTPNFAAIPYQQPPAPLLNRNPFFEAIARGTALHSKQKQRLSKMGVSVEQLLPKLQEMDIIRYSLISQIAILQTENSKMVEIIQTSDGSYDLTAIVHPTDEHSELILDYLSSVKARGNVATLLEERFHEGEVSLEDFLRMMRKNEESKFTEKYMLAKLLGQHEH